MIACTWNEDLARSFGEGIADMAEEMNVSGWYATAMNIHRTLFGGRNFEYYSEDSLLSGRIASQAATAASAGHPMAVMSSCNYIGTQWAGACDHLLNNVLRDEWGFQRSVLTDYFANFGYMDATRSTPPFMIRPLLQLLEEGADRCLKTRKEASYWG